MAKIAILGTGMLGSGMAQAAAERGDSVTVWNRTPAKAQALQRPGIAVADTPSSAVRDAERVHITVSDDAAVDGVLAQALSGFAPGVKVVDHTTVSPAGTVTRRAWCDEHGLWFMHAPVFMSPKACRDATGMMLCAGPTARFEEIRPALERMTGTVWHVGERVDLAAAYKLFGNAMIMTVIGGLADVFELAASLGVKATDAHALFAKLKVGGTVDIRGAKMAQGDFDPSFELMMARKDLRLMLEAVANPDALTMIPALAKRCDDSLARGLGDRDVGVIARDAVERANRSG